MKWFKHSSQFSANPDIEAIERYHGLPGYARLMKLYEQIAQRMDSSDQSSITMSLSQLETALAGKRKHLLEFLRFLQKIKVIRLTESEEQVVIELPELLQLRDNHTRNLQAAGYHTGKPEAKNTPNAPVLFTTQQQWQHWLATELCFTERQVNIPEHCRIMRQWLASNVTTDEVEQAVDQAVIACADIKQLANLHKLVAQSRKQRIEEARK